MINRMSSLLALALDAEIAEYMKAHVQAEKTGWQGH
jgi:hypothetical protein